MNIERDYLTRKEAAEYLKVCTLTIANYEKLGEIKSIKLNKRTIFYTKKELDKFKIKQKGKRGWTHY